MANQRLEQLLERFALDDDIRRGLYEALIERDDEVADQLRRSAAEQGLQPSITQLVVIQCGLGEPPEHDALVMLQRQASAEVEALHQQRHIIEHAIEALRREQEGQAE